MTRTAERAISKMALAVQFHPTGHHAAAWHHPRAQIDAGSNAAHYMEMARLAERGKFDLIFLADSLGLRSGDITANGRWPQYMAYFEPVTLLSAISSVTQRIGLVSTASTSYTEPFNLARAFASLDHLSSGRAGWNVVTTGNAASSRNFGREDHFEHDERYRRALEFVNVVKGLWDSWDDDAFVMDRDSGIYLDLNKMHPIQHQGDYFTVRGPLHMRRPPQGHPVVFQAGTSDAGRDLAAQIAEVVFMQNKSADFCRDSGRDIRARMAAYGRDPSGIRMLAGMSVLVAKTDAEAQEQQAFLQSRIHPEVGRAILSAELAGADLRDVDVDKPLPLDRIPQGEEQRTGVQNVLRLTREENYTVRQLYELFSSARGAPQIIGTPEHVADQLEHWFTTGAVDGFVIEPAVLPGGLADFVELVIPELQRRGLFRHDYEGPTLRDHLGLVRPADKGSRS